MVRFEVRRFFDFGAVRFRLLVVLLVAEAFEENLRVTCTLRPVLHDAHELHLSAAGDDFLEDRLIAFAEKVGAEEDQLLQSERILWGNEEC